MIKKEININGTRGNSLIGLNIMVIKATKPAMTNVNKMTYIVNWRGKNKESADISKTSP
ncbi:hypothetical protein JMUB7544_07990 [Staphylococcus aureus]